MDGRIKLCNFHVKEKIKKVLAFLNKTMYNINCLSLIHIQMCIRDRFLWQEETDDTKQEETVHIDGELKGEYGFVFSKLDVYKRQVHAW